jgi:hypothetical protein
MTLELELLTNAWDNKKNAVATRTKYFPQGVLTLEEIGVESALNGLLNAQPKNGD